MLSRIFRQLFTRNLPKVSDPTQIPDPIKQKLQEGFRVYAQGDFATATTIAEQLSQDFPRHHDVILLRCICLISSGEPERATPQLKRLVTDHPTSADAWKALGSAAEKCAQSELMLDCYRESLAINSQQVELESKLGIFMLERRRYQEALLHFERAVTITPAAAGYMNLGCGFITLGRPNLAYEMLTHALRLDPNMVEAHRGMTSAQLYLIHSPKESDKEIYAGYAASLRRSQAIDQPTNFTLSTHSGRIKIGYVTSDFRQHPVTGNMLPILARHDHLQFETHAYVDVEKADEYTARCQSYIEHWHDIHGLTDREVAQQIFNDGIDVLVILAGRFDKNRPALCMYGCAPVSISFHDAATSGLDEMDYLISDITMSPRDSREWFSERLVHLPTFYLREPIDDAPIISPLPVRTFGGITFGSFSNPAKLNPSVYSLWARVLNAVPGSRLVLKYFGRFNESDVREFCLAAFHDYGIETSRIDFLDDLNDRTSHLKVYQHIDIALDPFPFTGSTTTFEALWMGVPVVTLAGETMVGRWSASMLRRIGHPSWIAHSENEYLSICQHLANNINQLEHFRQTLREEVRHSPLCDAARRTHQLERVYRFTIGKWRSQHASHANTKISNHSMPSMDVEKEARNILALVRNGKTGPAAEMIEKLLARTNQLTKSNAEILNELSVALIDQANLFLASQVLTFVQKHVPTMPSVLCNLGIVNASINQFDEALRFFARALDLAPTHASTLFNYAVTLTQLERYEEANRLLDQLLAFQPDHLGAHLRLAEILRESGKIEHAVDYARRAVALAPDEPTALASLGNMLRDAGQMVDAESCFAQALTIQPDLPTAQLGLAFVHLLQEQFAEGWPLYEARKRVLDSTDRLLYFSKWDGQELHDKTLLVYGEQGIGDDIMFASCYTDLLAQVGKLVIDCEPRLRELYIRSFPQALVAGSPRYGLPTWLGKVPAIDYQIAAGSLPQHLRNTRAQFPAHHGYLTADPLRINEWREKLKRLGPGLKVGIAWKGGLGKTRAAVRSIPLSQWRPILSLKNCHFISLQPGKTTAEIEAMAAEGYEVAYWEDALADINETAALISALDLVITVCSTVVHLTGALGRPVWVLAPPVPEWRYTLSAEHMPWYPTSEMYRAKTENAWSETLDAVTCRLAQMVGEKAEY